MKKAIIVLLVALLTAGFVFADFSGDAYVGFYGDVDNKNYGFELGTDSSFSFVYTTDEVSIKGEDEIHLEVAASAQLLTAYNADGSVTATWDSEGMSLATGVVVDIDTVKIVGSNWYVSILGVASAKDYAKATVYTVSDKQVYDSFGQKYYKTSQAASMDKAYAKAPGVTIGYDGYTASVGFYHEDGVGTKASATIETKSFKFSDDAITVQAAAEASKKAGEPIFVGASAKTTVKVQDVKIDAAVDTQVYNIAENQDAKFAMDASAAAKYDFVTVNTYVFYGKDQKLESTYSDLYLEAKAAFNLKSFDVPVSVAVTAKNIVDKSEKGIDLGVSATYAQDAITAGAAFTFNTKTAAWTAKAYGIYAAENATFGANILVSGADDLTAIKAGAFAETDKLVDGVRFGVAYGLTDSYPLYYGGAYSVKNYKNNNNFINDTYGTVGAYCIVEF